MDHPLCCRCTFSHRFARSFGSVHSQKLQQNQFLLVHIEWMENSLLSLDHCRHYRRSRLFSFTCLTSLHLRFVCVHSIQIFCHFASSMVAFFHLPFFPLIIKCKSAHCLNAMDCLDRPMLGYPLVCLFRSFNLCSKPGNSNKRTSKICRKLLLHGVVVILSISNFKCSTVRSSKAF